MKLILKVLFANVFFSFTILVSAQVKFEKDFNLEPAKHFVYEWIEIDGDMYFSANDGYFGYELWKFDPENEEATRLTDLRPKGGDSEPKDMILYDNKIYFFAYKDNFFYQLYYYEPSKNKISAATDFLFDGYNSGGTVVYNDKLWFTGVYEGRSNLWNYDAKTDEFTEVLSPLGAHSNLFHPAIKVEYNNKIYFQGRSDEDKFILWSYDDINKVFTQEKTQYDDVDEFWSVDVFKVCNEKLIFRMDYGFQKLWVVYEEEVDSLQVISSDPRHFNLGCACIDNRFIFSNNDLQGITTFDTETGEIVYLVDEISNFPYWGKNIKSIDGKIYFTARFNNSYNNVFAYDPVQKKVELLPIFGSVELETSTLLKYDEIFYGFAENELEREIFKFNPQFSEPKMVADINKANRGGFGFNLASPFHVYDNRFYFNIYGANYSPINLWAKDIDGDNFYNISQIIEGDDMLYMGYQSSVNRNGRLYFSGARSSDGLKQLVSYKTGEDSLQHHLDIPHISVPYYPYFQGLMNYGDDLIFSVTTTHEYLNEFFKYNPDSEDLMTLQGTENILGTSSFLIDDILFITGTDSLNKWDYHHFQVDLKTGDSYEIRNDSLLSGTHSKMFRLGDKVAYGILEPVNRTSVIEIFNPITKEKKIVLPEGYDRLSIGQTGEFEDRVILYDHRMDHILFALDPVNDSCYVFLDLESQKISFEGELIEYDKKLYFEGYTFESGREVFEYDPSTGVTRLYEDINIGGGDSSPEDFKVIGDRLYFTADDGFRGHELWSLSNCFKASLDVIPDSLGVGEGQITVNVDGGQSPFSYKWNTGEKDKIITGLSSGFYEVQIEDANGCQVSVFTILEGGLISAVDDKQPSEQIQIFPNPVSDILYFDGLENFGKLKMSFYKANGILAKQKYFDKGVSAVFISDLAVGYYFLVLEREGQDRATYKLVVER